jgi:hypothetical protein
MMALRMKSLFLSVLTLLSLLIPQIVLGDATAIDWGTQSNQLKLSPGKSLTVTCPAKGQMSSRLWGTDIYTDDSSICTAAVHAGLINAASGGTVQVEGLAGQPGYRGSQRNGVGSRDYGGWTGSFAVKPAGSPPPPPPAQSAHVDASPQQAAASSNIQVTYQGTPGNARDWIGMFAVGAGERNWVTWQYTNGNRQGAMTFKAPDNKPGSYEFRMYENDGYKLLATSRPIQVGGAPPSVNKSLTGAWVHSAAGITQTPDSKVIVLHEGNQVTLVATYKMEVNRNQWQTYRCVGQLNGNELPVQCRWIEGGNPMSYGDSNWTMTFQVTPDRDHLNYKHTKPGPGQDAYYSRVP